MGEQLFFFQAKGKLISSDTSLNIYLGGLGAARCYHSMTYPVTQNRLMPLYDTEGFSASENYLFTNVCKYLPNKNTSLLRPEGTLYGPSVGQCCLSS